MTTLINPTESPLSEVMTVRVNQFCSSAIPVINHKDDDLSQSQEELTEVRDGVISVIHSREVYDIHSINDTLQVVQEGNSGPLHSCGPNWNLERNSSCLNLNSLTKCQDPLLMGNTGSFFHSTRENLAWKQG